VNEKSKGNKAETILSRGREESRKVTGKLKSLEKQKGNSGKIVKQFTTPTLTGEEGNPMPPAQGKPGECRQTQG
jgi:hypothetical protein